MAQPEPWLAHYHYDGLRYDEMFRAQNEARPHYAALYAHLLQEGSKQWRGLFNEVDRQIRDHGVTYNIYGDSEGASRPWMLDPLPLIIPADEWRQIEEAARQRARLFNHIVSDLYGQQNLLTQGQLPPTLILGQPAFLRPAAGVTPPQGVYLHLLAVDLARSPDGRWWVISDRTQAPSGLGYALENRLIVSRLFPDLFQRLRVRRLAPFFATFRDALSALAPNREGPTHTVLLTPGPYNETYFEHAFLARYLGFPLVEGSDLTVRDGAVWLKTLLGLRKIQVIVRRLDDDFCDPLEFRADSTLGVPGLMEAVRRGQVLVANVLGSGVLETGALAGFLPGLCEKLLQESLLMPNVATWWCGEPSAHQEALSQIHRLVFKGATPQRRFGPIFGEDLDAAGCRQLATTVNEAPTEFLAQELVALSRAPVLKRHPEPRLEPRSVGLRVFAVATPSGYVVMPGGLARTASEQDVRVLSNQRGGGSKDVWVCGESLGLPLSLLQRPVGVGDLVRSGAGLSSRVVENLFWFGRYTERTDHLARYLRVALSRIAEYAEAPLEWAGLAALGGRLGLLADAGDQARMTTGLLNGVADKNRPGSLAAQILHLSRTGFQLRERLSADNWRTLHALSYTLEQQAPIPISLLGAIGLLDRAVSLCMTLSGFALDGMTRDPGWLFLALGRRIERLQFQTQAIMEAMKMPSEANPEWLLEVSDSIVTYRSRYMARPEWLAVLDLLITDESNPRGLVFQTTSIGHYLEQIAALLGPIRAQADFQVQHRALLALDIGQEFRPDSVVLRETLHYLHTAAGVLADQLSLQFFSHVGQSVWVSA
ncbi:conserved hypothetical protein [Candidatus Competibacter denitrificans Run_A_D11]|uniref:Uncharacterized protein n=2 Tax=Candidatus Competibacter TaxID=221279 RepID=W6M1Q1_9GAMM|nr:conserved hypothetical protein [Candidatus Competibacter denitrificans Run_A_D11]